MALKVGLTAIPEGYALPSRPSAASPAVADAHRQTSFLLGGELGLFERLMQLQLRILEANRKARTPEAAAMFTLWSRVYSQLEGACVLASRGSYGSCMPLLRSACDCVAIEQALGRDAFGEYLDWFTRAVSQDKERAALAFDIGRTRAGSMFAEDRELGALFRVLTDLSMPHFGVTALLTAPESSLQKLSIAFADQAFHFGWAQIVFGWMLRLAAAQTTALLECGVLETTAEDAAEAGELLAATAAMLVNPARCRVEDADRSFVFHNFRRTASGQPKRVMLG